MPSKVLPNVVKEVCSPGRASEKFGHFKEQSLAGGLQTIEKAWRKWSGSSLFLFCLRAM